MSGVEARTRLRRGIGGFTLIEVIVAFTILALSLAAVMQAFSTGLLGLRRSHTHGTALMQARSKLSEVGRSIPLAAGETSGELDDGTAWRVTIDEAPSDSDEILARAPSYGMVLSDVVVEVSRPDGTTVSLRTQRLGRAQP